ncbi:MAG: aminotransferase [Planctomycetes bacterium]|nr:aminotransferase [Planctomycetota bacterium]
MIASRLAPFGTSIFGVMTRLATEHGAINLSQGFPDFEGPPQIQDWAAQAMRDGHNQYARPMGAPPLVEAIAANLEEDYGLGYDPMTEINVTSGATEGICSALLGLLNPGDEVLLFEPFYDSYPACIALAGATAKVVTLRYPDFSVDFDEVEALIDERTRLVMLNTPHNPTGKVWQRAELERLAELCQRHDLLVVSDEVYEHLWFDQARHVPIAGIDGMRERTLGISSTGKTFSYTGWKIGWVWGAQPLVSAVAAAHQFVTFATATPLQIAMARALRELRDDYLTQFRADYDERRQLLLSILDRSGFQCAVPQGSYFVLAAFDGLFDGTDVDLAMHLIRQHKVAAIPPSSFYSRDVAEGQRLLRFAFCKRRETLEAASQALADFRP